MTVTRRSAAVVGKTPEALFWGLAQPCSVRRRGIPERNQASGIFQDLRSLRELDLALEQSRVVDGIALHPNAIDCEPAESLGFLVDEVIQAYGGPQVEQVCGNCPANFLQVAGKKSQTARLAGCFGVLPISNPGDHPLIAAVEDRYQEARKIPGGNSGSYSGLDRQLKRLSETQPAWYGLWGHSPIHDDDLASLLELFRRLTHEPTEAWRQPTKFGETLINRSLHAALHELTMAIEVAYRLKIPLHVEYIPAGYSDGVLWRVFAHCQICKFSYGADRAHPDLCACCGVRGFVQAERTRKVLGLRPYLFLEKIIGRNRTNEVRQAAVKQAVDRLKTGDPSGG